MVNRDRLRVLSRLAQAPLDNEAANAKLAEEGSRSINVIKASNDLGLVAEELEVIEAIIHRLPKEGIEELFGLLKIYSDSSYPNESELSYPPSSASITCSLLKVLGMLRYTEENVKRLLETYLEASLHTNAQIASTATELLADCSKLNLHVYENIGLAYHLRLLQLIESLEKKSLRGYFNAVVDMIEPLFATEMEKTTGDYQSVTLHFGGILGTDEFQEMRSRALSVAKQLYSICDNTIEQIKVIALLNSACRSYFRQKPANGVLDMLEENQIEVLSFYSQIAQSAPLEVLQKIEHDGYWVFYHAHSDRVREVGRILETTIASNSEYTIYKTLVGFEGVFHPWDDRDESNSRFSEIQEKRTERAVQWANEVTEEAWPIWRKRILEYLQRSSNDLATFPIFHRFVQTLSEKLPRLMLGLIQEERANVEPAIIPIIKGLWASKEQASLKAVVRDWLHSGEGLYPIVKSFLSLEEIDDELLTLALDKALEIKDEATLSVIVAVVIVHYEKLDRDQIDTFFKVPLSALTEKESIMWMHGVWHRRDRLALIAKLDEEGINLILENFAHARTIDYEMEVVLASIAADSPEKVLDFFRTRIVQKFEQNQTDIDAIPYRLTELAKVLGKHSRLTIRTVYEWSSSNTQHQRYYVGELIKALFPKIEGDTEAALLEILNQNPKQGGSFLISVLHHYDGELCIYDLVKVVLATSPSAEELKEECYMIIAATGVVQGEFGFAEAYERRVGLLASWLDDERDAVRSFAREAIERLKKSAEWHRKKAEEDIALRKLQYGEGKPKA